MQEYNSGRHDNGPISEPDVARDIAVDNAGNSYVTGYSQGVNLDFATIKYNTNGSQQWVSRYNGTANSGDLAYAIALDKAGNVYVAGSDQTTIYNSDYRTIKYNSSGALQWTAKYNGPANDNDEAFAVGTDVNGNVYVTGYINGTSPSWDIATIKYNSSGSRQWVKTYNGPGHGNDNGSAIATDTNGNVYVAGTSAGASSDLDFVTLKYSSTATAARTITNTNTIPVDKNFVTSENPVKDNLILQLPGTDNFMITITDNSGRKIFEQKEVSGQTLINFSTFSKGMFILRATSDKLSFNKKIIK
jgi:hypothetical protein